MKTQRSPKPHSRGRVSTTATGERKALEKALALEKQLAAARYYAESIIEAVPPLLVLDGKLRVQTANESFCKAFHISAQQTLNRLVYRLGNGQWNIPSLRTLLEEVLPKKKFFKDFEVTHEFEKIGRRTMLLSGRQVDNLQRILLLIIDITEPRQTQAAVQLSEIRYRRLFEAARDGILILNPATRRITDANPFMTELLGYRHEELLNKELWQIGLLKDEKASRKAFRELQRNHFIRYEDLPLQNKVGEPREVEFVSNLYDEDGREVIQCNIRDITRRKQTVEMLRESEERFHAIFNQASAGIAQTDFSGRFTLANQGYCEIAGRKVKDLLGRKHQDITYPADRKANEMLLKRLKKDGRGFVTENRYLRPNRDVIWVRNSVSLVNHRSPRRGYLLWVTQDISEQKRAERALHRAKDEMARHALRLEQLVQERTRELRQTVLELEGFSYSVSHDMRAPLRAMQSFAQFLVEEYQGKLDERGVYYLQQIMRSAVRLDRLIQDVLSYTKIINGKLPLEPVDLDRLVRDIIETFPNGLPIKPEIQIQGSLPQVLANSALLAQCVSNLLSNGAKFVAAGTTPRVQVSADAPRNGRIRVWFRDNGIGVAPKDHERIFRLFERIYPSTEYEGTGIGLTIVRKAAERMGARVGFDSELGKGSNFWIELKKG